MHVPGSINAPDRSLMVAPTGATEAISSTLPWSEAHPAVDVGTNSTFPLKAQVNGISQGTGGPTVGCNVSIVGPYEL